MINAKLIVFNMESIIQFEEKLYNSYSSIQIYKSARIIRYPDSEQNLHEPMLTISQVKFRQHRLL